MFVPPALEMNVGSRSEWRGLVFSPSVWVLGLWCGEWCRVLLADGAGGGQGAGLQVAEFVVGGTRAGVGYLGVPVSADGEQARAGEVVCHRQVVLVGQRAAGFRAGPYLGADWATMRIEAEELRWEVTAAREWRPSGLRCLSASL
jgi:hypothetical protein